jgi:hypothetical protein
MLDPNHQDDEEQFEDSDYGKAQKDIYFALKNNLEIYVRLQQVITKTLKFRHSFTKEEQVNHDKIADQIDAHLTVARDAYSHAQATAKNDCLSLIQTNIHLFYANRYIDNAKHLLDKHERTINSRVPKQSEQPKAKL